MKDNIYIKALEIGFKNEANGITFNEIVKELGIEKQLANDIFRTNFTIWFYTNFYNWYADKWAMASKNGTAITSYRITPQTIEKIKKFNTQASFIKGESIQKYIDYLELKESRESSQTAKKISYISIGIALLSIFLSPFISRVIPESPKQVIVTENWDKTNDTIIIKKLTKLDSTIINAINKLSLIADKKEEVPDKKKSKFKPMKN